MATDLIFTLPSYEMSTVEEMVAKLNKRAEKLELAPVVINTIRRETKKLGKGLSTEVVTFSIENPVVVLGGWELLAKIIKMEDKNFIISLGKEEIPKRFRETSFFCDHCSSNRARMSIFVLRNESGEYIQVGKSCLRDYTGVNNADKLVNNYIAFLEMIQGITDLQCIDDSDFDYFGQRSQYSLDLEEYLTEVVCCVRVEGSYKTKSSCVLFDEIPTSESALLSLIGRSQGDESMPSLIDSDREIAQKAIERVKAFSEAQLDSSFNYNMNVIALAGHVNPKQTGTAAYIVQAYLKGNLRSEILSSQDSNEFLGEVGEKITVEAIYFNSTYIHNRTKYSDGFYIHNFKDLEGNAIVWVSAKSLEEMTPSQRCKLKGKVKEHRTYRGTKQTSITRAKIL